MSRFMELYNQLKSPYKNILLEVLQGISKQEKMKPAFAENCKYCPADKGRNRQY